MSAASLKGKPVAATNWEPLVEALRGELKEFGGLIRLLEIEQNQLLARTGGPGFSSTELAGQIKAVEKHTCERKALMNGSAGGVVPGSQIVASYPVDIQPLLTALFSEVETLEFRAKERMVQNKWLRERESVRLDVGTNRAISIA